MCNRLNPLACLMLLLLIAPVMRADNAPAFEPYEAWFVLNMGGQKAGHMHVTLTREGDTIVNATQMRVAIKRGQAEITIEQASRFVETLDHQPVEASSSMKFATMGTEQHLDFTGEQWTLTSTNAGQKSVTQVDPPGVDWLTPGALSAVMEAAIERGDETITVTTLDLSTGTSPIEMTMRRDESADIEVFGKVVPATRWTMTVSAMPGLEIEQWTDDQGQPVRQVIPLMPGMEMEMLLADEALALAEYDAPEMLAASLITPNKRIDNPRTLKRGVFDLVSPGLKESLGEAVVNDGYQRTQWIDDNTLRVTVNVSERVESDDARVDDAYLLATTMLNFDDIEIQKLIKTALKEQDFLLVDDPDNLIQAAAFAESMRKTVRDHIDAKDLSVGFASASEVARTGQGDCTEHGCLLAAMLRGAGIPSRTVTGIVYVDQFVGNDSVFGFHMWAQAWIATGDDSGYWLDLDASAPGEINGFDATHIAFTTSAMQDGEVLNDMVTMLPLMAGLEINVIELEWAE